jgi:hypothetical protein
MLTGCKVRNSIHIQIAALEEEINKQMTQNLGSNYVIFEVFMVVTMKNVAFWDIKTQFVLHRRHITSLLQSPAS